MVGGSPCEIFVTSQGMCLSGGEWKVERKEKEVGEGGGGRWEEGDGGRWEEGGVDEGKRAKRRGEEEEEVQECSAY